MEECIIHLYVDGGFINNCNLDAYLYNYLKEVTIYGFSKLKYCYLDIQTKPFSVRMVGCKYRKSKWIGTYDEQFDCDLTEEFEPLLEKISNINEDDGISEFEIILNVAYDVESKNFDIGYAHLVFEEFDKKIDITHCSSKLESYFESPIHAQIENDLEKKYDPDKAYEHYHYF